MYEKVTKEITLLTNNMNTINQFQEEFLKIVSKAIPFEAACFTTIDPNIFLSTGAYTDASIEKIHPELFMNEFLEEDYNKFKDLVLKGHYVSSLHNATDGNRIKSSRYRNILMPAGFQDEVRVVFISKGKCFGHLSLFRSNTNALFHYDECLYLSTIISLVGDALRRVFIVCSAERIEKIETGTAILNEEDLPRPIRAVCSRVKANQNDKELMSKEEKVCMRLSSGQCIVIRASKLECYSSLANCYVVLLEMARPEDAFLLIVDSYNLSLREKEVIDGILRGMTTKELAEELRISKYTVQDHLKSIFNKVGVYSRSELVWEVFSKFSFPVEIR
ncbi:LuxR family transcriptional regulator [Bacillus clarus]|uniref:LuxR family transcriptional regulator n=1 Tax=Bacillus clarus TaxID=2338372 RepID=A0ABX9KYQ7_9BACI|nr:helix-turn-helix transcriptional regulator [Bacillus clarus]RFT67845.1 LuxR family transcriptional regulator [Bacillus clarus]